MNKIAVAMSGGVDSSVTAALMVKEYGAENVFGVTMRLFCYGEAEADEKSCCSTEAVSDARAICEQLGIPHYAVNMEKEFEQAVIRDFVSEYQKGRTPIPCVLCNTIIKFDKLLKKVEEFGATHLATGHYVRVETREEGAEKRHFLLKGTDQTKDQSYFLYGLTQAQLAKTIFPLGDKKKSEVRILASGLNLKTAQKKESQGICFITEGRVTDYLMGKVKTIPGDIITTAGEKIGEHEGIVFYTVGQRKRIGGGYEEPMFVVRVDPKNNQVVIGTKEDLYQKELAFEKPNWILGEPPKGKIAAKIRYNMEESPCKLQLSKFKNSNLNRNSKLETQNYIVVFAEAQRAITPGQSIVFYDGGIVLGGAIIKKII